MHLPDLPNEIDWEALNRALESIGIPPEGLVETVIRANSVTVTYTAPTPAATSYPATATSCHA